MCLYICIYIYIIVNIQIQIKICQDIHVCIYTYMHWNVRTDIFSSICIYRLMYIYIYIYTLCIYIYRDVCRPHLPVFLFSLHLYLTFYPIVYWVSAESLYKHSATTKSPEANLAHQGCLWQILQGPGSPNSNKIHQKPETRSQHCDQSIRGPLVFYLRKLHFQCGRLWYRGNEPNWTKGVDAIGCYAA